MPESASRGGDAKSKKIPPKKYPKNIPKKFWGVHLVREGSPRGRGVPGPRGNIWSRGCTLSWGVYLVPGGVPDPGAVYLVLGGIPGPRGSGPGGVPGLGGVSGLGSIPGPGGCTWSQGGVPGPGGGCLVWGHTWSWGGIPGPGGCLVWGVSGPRGVESGGCVSGPGGCLVWGVSGPGGVVSSPGGLWYPGMH